MPGIDHVPVSVKLTLRERRLLVDEVLPCSELLDSLEFLKSETGYSLLDLTLDEWVRLAEGAAFAANHARDLELERDLDALSDRIESILYSLQVATDDSELPCSGIVHELPSAGPSSIDIARDPSYLDELPSSQPAPCVEQLPPAVQDGISGMLRFSDSLPLADLQDALFFRNCRELLSAVLEAKRVKATSAGNLNRKFVLQMLDRGHWPPGYVEEPWAVNRVLNEEDVFLLHIPRVVCELARLLRYVKSTFRVTKRGRTLLADENAGDLYGLLFLSFFRKMRLAYLDRLPHSNALEDMVPIFLSYFSVKGRHWYTAGALTEAIHVPLMETDFAISGALTSAGERVCWALNSRLLEPLVDFGLLEEREAPTNSGPWDRKQYRKTELYDKFITVPLLPGGLGSIGDD